MKDFYFGKSKEEIISKIDHTILKVDCVWEDVKRICDEAKKYKTASVCIPPCFVKKASEYLNGKIPVCTVIGFPNGYMTTEAKVFETSDAVKNGADEIDMVINVSKVKDGEFDYVSKEIKQIRKACEGKILKVIIETCLLSDEEKIKLCHIVSESGADFIKTSTGFSKYGATREDVKILKDNSVGIKVKAAGGIKSVEDAVDFINLGAERLGTSSLLKMME
ncbi:MAG: deoxyribose-phosphate aldolase [Ruminococcaceae bacterium]|nr:deoxyribose-phosphate aldolase [Oscillospiraceae bacterium]